MKTLAFLLLALIITSCSITTETTDVHCWKHRICTGDTYMYHRTPAPHNTYVNAQVTVIEIKSNRAKIKKQDNGDVYWVDIRDLQDNSTPEKILYHHGKGRGPRK